MTLPETEFSIAITPLLQPELSLSKDIELRLYSKAWLCSSRRNCSWQANGTTRIYSKASI